MEKKKKKKNSSSWLWSWIAGFEEGRLNNNTQ
jgi:hypothetical protein